MINCFFMSERHSDARCPQPATMMFVGAIVAQACVDSKSSMQEKVVRACVGRQLFVKSFLCNVVCIGLDGFRIIHLPGHHATF